MKASEILKDYIERGLTSGYTGGAITDVLKEAVILFEMKEQDRLIGLPVPIGSIVYGINTDDSQVLRMLFRSSQIDAVLKWWGITVFATREEAEAKIRELKNG